MALSPSDKLRLDLHMHSVRSDGELDEEALVRRAAQRRLDVIALTDHDTGPSLAPGEHRFGEHSVFLVHAAEVSALHEAQELHILCYFPSEMPDGFRRFLHTRQQARWQRYDEACARLGVEPDRPDVVAVTRVHLARRLVACGRAPSVHRAFQDMLSYDHGEVDPIGAPIDEVLEQAATYGGITSWAHPDPDQAAAWAPELSRRGLWGLETGRPGLGRAVRHRVTKIARKAGLHATGGSDWHGFGGDLGVFSFPLREARPFVAALQLA